MSSASTFIPFYEKNYCDIFAIFIGIKSEGVKQTSNLGNINTKP